MRAGERGIQLQGSSKTLKSRGVRTLGPLRLAQGMVEWRMIGPQQRRVMKMKQRPSCQPCIKGENAQQINRFDVQRFSVENLPADRLGRLRFTGLIVAQGPSMKLRCITHGRLLVGSWSSGFPGSGPSRELLAVKGVTVYPLDAVIPLLSNTDQVPAC